MSYWLRMDSDPPESMAPDGYAVGAIWTAGLVLGALVGVAWWVWG